MRLMNKRSRTVRVTAGALAIAAPTSAVALAADQAGAQTTLQIKPSATHLEYRQPLAVSGLVPRADGGQRLALEFSAEGSPWKPIAYTRVHSDGAFRVRAPLVRSGAVRIAPASAPASSNGPRNGPASASAAGATPAGATRMPGTPAPATNAATPPGAALIPPSQPQPVAVAAKLVASTGAIDALGGRRLELRGELLPRRAGRLVRLQSLARGHWRTLAVARTRASGRYVVHYLPAATHSRTVRFRFRGDSRNAAVSTAGRRLVLLEPAVASWYEDGGNTACGFHAADGIANKELPCGTKVTIAYHGRTVTAVVDDRGPFVAGREFDLNQSTAAALGFNGVDTVWSAVAPAPHARRRKATSARRRSLARKCSIVASHTSTWTRSTCRLSFGGGRSFGARPWWSQESGRVRL